MAANSKTASLERCLMSLENTLKSTTTGRPKFKRYIEETSGSQRNDHILVFDFLVECLEILSDETSVDDKLAKASELVNGEAIKDPPKVIINPELREKLQNPADVAQLEGAVRDVFALNSRSTLSVVFDDFVVDERARKAAICGAIANPKKKSRTCETL